MGIGGAKKATQIYTEAGFQKLRPNARMPLAAHEKIGETLKAAYKRTYGQTGITTLIHQLQCQLDDWLMLEYGRGLTHEQFWGTYFGAAQDADRRGESVSAMYKRFAAMLAEVKNTLAEHYPSCAPLLAVLKKIDRVSERLEALHAR